jgi:outer membrane protein
MKRLVSVGAALLLTLPSGWAQTHPPIPTRTGVKPELRTTGEEGLHFTLKQAEDYALANNPQIASAKFNADAVRQQIREARSAFFPQIYGESTSVYAPYDTQSGSATRLAALGGLNNPTVYSRQSDGVTLNQLITDFGHTYDLTESAKYRADAATERVNVARAIIVLAVDRTYFDVLRAHAVLGVAEETVKTRATEFDQAAALVKHELKSTLDESVDQVALSQAKLLLIQAQSGVQEAEAALSAAMGFADAQHFVLAEVPLNLELPDSAEYLIQFGLSKRPELAALREQSEAAERLAKAQQEAEYPKITALAAAGINPVANDKLVNHNYYAAGVNVELPIANGGNLDAKTQEARLLKLAADQDLIDAQNTISRDVREAWLNLATDKQRIAVTSELIKNAAEARRLADARYRLGTSSIVEFNAAELNYTEAELENATAKYDYQSARALLNFTTGASF